MATKKKVFVCYDKITDATYFDMLEAWLSEDVQFVTYDPQPERVNTPKTIANFITAINERIKSVEAFVLLVSESTRNLEYNMMAELNVALANDIPIIAINVNGLRSMDDTNCPSLLKEKHVLHIAFDSKAFKTAIDVWPNYYRDHLNDENLGPRYFKDTVYQNNDNQD